MNSNKTQANHAIIITGTDTDIGKTYVSTLLLQAFNQRGLKTFGIKPIASGCIKNDKGEYYNSDALQLQQASSIQHPYKRVNPITLHLPIAPHIAAAKEGIHLDAGTICQTINNSIDHTANINIIELAGGWCVPLNKHQRLSDVVIQLHWPVIVVIGIRLGCLNHALLTIDHMQNCGITPMGWIANLIDPNTLEIDSNIQTLKHWISAPLLGTIPYRSDDVRHININYILEIL